ncbi:Inositol-1-monophosphatase [Usitatibacter rugosus]|uniref:Inositol-1-monophosphatase n=2 Tax=Usitatibacter rugosus TaxID=2732067 RepID=A0A6M4GT58_9PROT|nr:Inositol-1-monophosphatase [Usitatibacter rugosus]
MLNTAVKAARKAGAVINRGANDLDRLTIHRKRQNDYVSEVDHAAEAEIIKILKEAYPTHGFLAEESGKDRAKNEYVWCIDPLDGTTNFLHGNPQYCVSIALLHNGVPEQGVVFDPNRNELFTATKGSGAYLNERRIRTSKLENFKDSLIATGFPFREESQFDEYIAQFSAMVRATAGLRRPGAAALDLAWVACGRVDGFWEIGLSPWDMAAGALLVREAGGRIGDLQGEDKFLESGKVVASNPKIFTQLLKTLGARAESPQ